MTGSVSYSWNRARRFWAVTALLLAAWSLPLAAMPLAQRHERRHEIDHLEELWRVAMLKDDTTTMSSLLADDYIAITPAGTLQNKDEALASLRGGRSHFTTLDITDRKIRFYGATAIVTSTANVQGATPEGNLSGTYRYTRVYARDARGIWKIVSFEANRILGPGESH